MKIRETAGGVVLSKDGMIAVVKQQPDSWSLPKGHVEPGEALRAAAEREIKEETGLTQLEFIRELGVYKRRRIPLPGRAEDHSAIKQVHVYLYKTKQEALCPQDPHNPEALWVKIGDVDKKLTHQKDREFFRSIKPDIKQAAAKL